MTPAAPSPGVDLTGIIGALARELAPLVAGELMARSSQGTCVAPTVAPLVDKRELARLLAVSPATVDRLVRAGLPFQPVGDVRRFDHAAVLAWLGATGQRPARSPAEGALPVGAASKARDPIGMGGVRLLSRPARRGGHQ